MRSMLIIFDDNKAGDKICKMRKFYHRRIENMCRSAKDSNQIDLEPVQSNLLGKMRFNPCVRTIKIQKDRKLQVHFIGKSKRRAERGKGKWVQSVGTAGGGGGWRANVEG